MLGFSAEHLIVLTVILLLFGPKVLPGLGSTLGRSMRMFREHSGGLLEADFRKLGETILRPGSTNAKENSKNG